MKKIIISILISIFLLISCNNKLQKDKKSNDSYLTNHKYKLDERLKEKLFNYIKDIDLESPIIYTVEFYNERMYGTFDENDTIIKISFLFCGKDTLGYKGIMKIDNYIVAIFDKKNIGRLFYNNDSLLKINYNKLKCKNETVIGSLVLFLKESEIYEWGTKI